MKYFLLFILILIIQRITELIIAKKNEQFLLSKGAVIYDKKGYHKIVLLHTSFIVSLIIEYIYFNRNISEYWIYILFIYFFLQIFRYIIILSLGKYWNTKLIFLPNHPLVKKGPYKYFKHPNYLVVIAEFIIIPLLFSCYFTLIIFSILNAIVLYRRIKTENELMSKFGIPA